MADYLSVSGAAEVTGLSPQTIRRALRDGRCPLRHYRPGRRVIIARDDLDAWIKAHAAMPLPSPEALEPDVREFLAPLRNSRASERQEVQQPQGFPAHGEYAAEKARGSDRG